MDDILSDTTINYDIHRYDQTRLAHVDVYFPYPTLNVHSEELTVQIARAN